MLNSKRPPRQRWSFFFFSSATFLLLLCAAWLFFPGLNGGAQFDDFINLFGLINNDNNNLDALAQFAANGEAGPTGRPVSLFTFAVNYYLTGNNFWYFKATGLAIHLLNGLLIVFLSRKLFSLIAPNKKSLAWMSLALGALWLLHPMQISTALYIVQRMTALSSSFVLLGLLAYLNGREWLPSAPAKAWRRFILLVAPALVLAVFSKENGILLLAYIAVLEFTLLSPNIPSPSWFRSLVYIGMLIPLAVVAWYTHWNVVYTKANGSFTALERLSTEGPVLWHYLRQILLPDIRQMTLFHDDIQIIRSVFDPTAVLAWSGIIIAVGSALLLRKKLPVLAFAILWFFSGHLLESTTLGLELYFEHRNYLPMFGPLFALVWYLGTPHLPAVWIRRAALAGLILLNGWLTWQLANLWSDNEKLAVYWAEHHPKSYRSQVVLASHALQKGQGAAALNAVNRSIEMKPELLVSHLRKAFILCKIKPFAEHQRFMQTLPKMLQSTHPSTELVPILEGLTEAIAQHQCSYLTANDWHRLLKAIRNNPKLRKKGRIAFTWEAQAMLYATESMPKKTEAALQQAISTQANLRTLLWYARIAAAQNKFDLAEKRLQRAYRFIEDNRVREWANKSQVDALKAEIRQWQKDSEITPQQQ